MKKRFLIISLGFMLYCIGCSKDNSTSTPTVQANDMSIILDEHPELGARIGKVEGANLENAIFKIVSQNPDGAFEIDAYNGEITIADASLFDYEINTVLSAQLTVNNEVSSDASKIEVSLSDIDELELYLTDSKEAYLEAQNGGWVLITAEEYETLAEALVDVSRIGTTTTEYNASGPITTTSENFTFAQDRAYIPEGTYIFAFKYDNGSNASTHSKLKISTSQWNGYTDFGPILPPHGLGEHYFLLKGSNEHIQDKSYLGFYNENSIRWMRSENSTTQFYFGFGDNSTMEQVYGNFIARYQGLGTSLKQWK